MPVLYHSGAFPPVALDWPRLIPLLGPAAFVAHLCAQSERQGRLASRSEQQTRAASAARRGRRTNGLASVPFNRKLIYVDGDNKLKNLEAPDDTWKVRLIADDFFRSFHRGHACRRPEIRHIGGGESDPGAIRHTASGVSKSVVLAVERHDFERARRLIEAQRARSTKGKR